MCNGTHHKLTVGAALTTTQAHIGKPMVDQRAEGASADVEQSNGTSLEDDHVTHCNSARELPIMIDHSTDVNVIH